MKNYLIKITGLLNVLILSGMLFTGCIDELKICPNDYGEGNVAIHLNTNGKYYTRDGEEITAEYATAAATDDENYIAVESDDYCFYFFDAESGDFVKEYTPYDVVSKNFNETGYSFILKVDEEMKDVNIVTLANLKSFGVEKYPSFKKGQTLKEVYQEVAHLFDYTPVEGKDKDGNTIYYSWTPNASEGRGIPMFGISPRIGIRDQINDVTIPVVRALAKIEVEYYETKEAIKHDGFAIYIYNESGWDDVYVYPWVNKGNGETGPLGDIVWPGLAPTGKVMVKGKEYYYYDLGKEHEGETINVILNNGKGYQIDGPQNYRINRDYYLKLSGENDAVEWEIVDMDYKHVGNTVYVKNETDWDDIYLYAYRYIDGENDEILGPSWPGRLTGKEVINGDTYFFFDLEDITGENVNFIFNNGKTKQLTEMFYNPKEGAIYDTYYETVDGERKLLQGDMLAKFEGNELYIKLQNDKLEISPEGFTFYVKNSTGWSNVDDDLYLYLYGDKYMEGGAPGMKSQGKKKIAGEEYHYFHLNEDWVNLKENLIFSDGKNHQLPSYEFTLSRNNYPGGLYLEIAEPFSNIKVEERELIISTPEYVEPSSSEYDTNINAHRVYIKDETGWGEVYLYAWGDEECFGGWPGKTIDGTVSINNETYKYFELPADLYRKTEHLIFNNNNGTQLPDFNISTCRDYYLELKAEGLSEITEHPEIKPSYRVYVVNNTGWEDVYLYTWGDKECLGGWPGLKGENFTKDGKNYLMFSFPYGSEGLLENLIFNNGNGEQLSDYVFEISGDLYLTMAKSHDVKYGLENLHESVNINVLNKVGWDAIKIYAYNQELFGGWDDTDLIFNSNTGYYTISIDEDSKYKESLNKSGVLMFHDGSNNDEYKIQYGNEPFSLNQDLYVALNKSKRIVQFEEGETVDKQEEDYYFKAVTLSYYNMGGSLIPDLSGDKNSDWSNTDKGLDTPTLPANIEQSTQEVLYFVWDNRSKLWIAYIPEMDLSSGRPNLHLFMKPFDDETEGQEKDYEFGLDTSYHYKDNKAENEPTVPIADDVLQSVLRNTIYHYSAGRNHKNFEIKYTVCDWDEKEAPTITFD